MPLFRNRVHSQSPSTPDMAIHIRAMLLIVLLIPACAVGSEAVDSHEVSMEADLLTEQAYLLDAASLQDRLTSLQQRWANQPELFEATLVAWIRALAHQPSDPVLNETLTALGDYQSRVMTDHPDRIGVQVPQYTIAAEIAATRNAWILFETEQQTAELLANDLPAALDQQLDQLSHRQAIAGVARALTHAINQGAGPALTEWLLNTADERPVRASVFNIMIDQVDQMSWRDVLSAQILAHGNSVDQALHLRLLDARMGRHQAITIRQQLLDSDQTPLTLYRLALTEQARALPDDSQLISTAIRDLESSERATASAFSLSKTDPTLTRSMLLATYPQLTPPARTLSRLVMQQRRDLEALDEMSHMDSQELPR